VRLKELEIVGNLASDVGRIAGAGSSFIYDIGWTEESLMATPTLKMELQSGVFVVPFLNYKP
jgi:hypothetical protein